MNNNNGAISFESYINTDAFFRNSKAMEDRILGVSKYVYKESIKIDDSLAKIKTDAFNNALKASENSVLSFSKQVEKETQRIKQSFNGMADEIAKFHATNGRRSSLNLSKGVPEQAKEVEQSISIIGKAMGTYLTFNAAKDFVSDIVRVRGEFQQLEIAFNTMLGSKVKADKLMGEIIEFAAKTPFGLETTSKATKMLLAYGESADTVIETMRKLGDISSGIGAPLQDIAYLYGTTMTQGRLYTQDLNQFTGRGIPMIKELAKQFGVAESEVRALVETGKVGFPEVQKVINSLTASGSMFGGLMEAQSKSIGGQIEQLKDAWDQMLNSMGKNSEGVINSSISGVAYLVQHYETVGKVLTSLVATYGAYKAAMIALMVVEKVRARMTVVETIQKFNGATMVATQVTKQLTAAQAFQTIATNSLAKAEAFLNATLLANPYVLLTVGIVALVGATWALHDSTTAQERAQTELNKRNEEAKKNADELKSSIQAHLAVIQDVNATELQRVQSYDELLKKVPRITDQFTLQQLKVLGIAESAKLLNVEMDKINTNNLVSGLEKTKSKIKDLEAQLKSVRDNYNNERQDVTIQQITNKLEKEQESLKIQEQQIEVLKEQEAQAKFNNSPEDVKVKILEQQKKSVQGIIDKLKEQSNIFPQINKGASTLFDTLNSIGLGPLQVAINRLNQIDGLMNAINKGNDPKKRTVSYLEEEISKVTKAYKDGEISNKEATTTLNKLNKEAADKQLNLIDYNKKAPKVKTSKLDIALPIGSLAEYERQIAKLKETLSKMPVIDANAIKIKEAQDQILVLTEQRAVAEKAIEIRTWQETLDEKQKQYQAFEAAIQASNDEDAVKEKYKDLLGDGDSYLAYVKKELDKLRKAESKEGDLSTTDYAKMSKLQNEKDTLLGISTPMELFNEMLQRTQKEASNTTEYIDILKAKLAELEITRSNDSETLTKINTLRKELKDAELVRKDALAETLKNIEGSEQQKTAIQKKYADLRVQALSEGKDVTGVDQLEKNELAEWAIKANVAFQELNNSMFNTAKRKDLLRIRDLSKNAYEIALNNSYSSKKDIDSAKYNYDAANAQLLDRDIAQWKEFNDVIEELGSNLEQLGGTWGTIGGVLSGVSSGFDGLADSFKQIKDGTVESTDAYIAAAKFAIQAITAITNAAAQRKAKEEEYYRSSIALQHEYNMALNEQIRLQAQSQESLFIKDYEGRIRSGYEAITDATAKYSDAMKQLDKASVKTGTKKVVDGKTTGQLALSGLGAGAMVGSLVGPLGTAIGGAIGAIVGAAVGVFTAKKVVDVFGPLLENYPALIDAQGNFNIALAESLISSDKLDENSKAIVQNIIDGQKAIDAAREQIEGVVSELAGDLGNNLRDALVSAFEDGTDAGKAFANSVADTLESVVSNILFSNIFGDAFKQLEDTMKKSYDIGGDGSWEDDLTNFFKENNKRTEEFQKALQQAKDAADANGLKLFDNASKRDKGSLSGGIQSITEDSASIISGQMNAMRINQEESQQLFLQQISHLASINYNTSYLIAIDAKLSRVIQNNNGNTLRDFGINGV